MGEGPPLVKAANWLQPPVHDRESTVWRHWLAELSARHRLVRYDERGCGLSEWEVEDLSFEAWVNDLEAVVETVGLERFPLLGISQGGPVAVAYAVRHPERVATWCSSGPSPRAAGGGPPPTRNGRWPMPALEIVRVGWGQPDPQYRQISASRFLPEGSQAEWRAFDEPQLQLKPRPRTPGASSGSSPRSTSWTRQRRVAAPDTHRLRPA